MKILRLFRHWIWLSFGGHRIEGDFQHLAKDIQKNRKLISELRQSNYDLKARLWGLEGHALDETMEMIKGEMEEWEHESFDLADKAIELEDTIGENK